MHAVAQSIDAEIYVNIQGDEPFLRPEHIAALLLPFNKPEAQRQVDVTTLKVLCTPENIGNPNAVKVVTAADGRALYFSRAIIPYHRDAELGSGSEAPVQPHYWKHIGLYAFRKAALEAFCKLPASSLEKTERLEQLRLLENGMSVYVEATQYDTIGIDTEEDLRLAESILIAGFR
jgi:3-deoxy-manno-octulosonate cytidylyltransferase (CMP-KDO synthetase)